MMMFITPTTSIVVSCGHYDGAQSVIKKTWHIHTDAEGNILPVLREDVVIEPVSPTEMKGPAEEAKS